MNRAVVIAALVLVAAVSSAATVLIVNSKEAMKPALTQEQRTVREKFFGSSKELPPIKDGQEMRPRW
ncbi:entry exclusion protein TrbK (plasmid) [Agrobacterium deltaense]|uniref:entry exclusion protein TrbK n=1 Tax=Agrobacterium deltaense TaxID=1183412 RepID=UPI003D95600C